MTSMTLFTITFVCLAISVSAGAYHTDTACIVKATPTAPPTARPTYATTDAPVKSSTPVSPAPIRVASMSVPVPAPAPAPTAAPTAAPTSAPAPAPGVEPWQQDMLDQVNKLRDDHNLGPLCLSPKLTKASQLHSEDMSAHKKMTHVGTVIANFGDRIKAQDMAPGAARENIAAGQPSVTRVMTSWINSPGHLANLLSVNSVVFGCGKENYYWTQNFSSIKESCIAW